MSKDVAVIVGAGAHAAYANRLLLGGSPRQQMPGGGILLALAMLSWLIGVTGIAVTVIAVLTL